MAFADLAADDGIHMGKEGSVFIHRSAPQGPPFSPRGRSGGVGAECFLHFLILLAELLEVGAQPIELADKAARATMQQPEEQRHGNDENHHQANDNN